MKLILILILTITTAQAKWIKKSSWVSKLSRVEQKRLLGAKDLPNNKQLGEFSSKEETTGQAELPNHFDWRNVNGKNYLSPIKNQGHCGSCVIFAAVGAMEAQVQIANEWPELDFDLSEQHVLNCSGGSCGGWWTGMGVQFLRNKGAPVEAHAPYYSGSLGEDLICTEEDYENPSINFYKLKNYQSISYTSSFDYTSGTYYEYTPATEDILKALLKGPLVTSMTVYEDFLTYKSGVYSYESGDRLGGHAIVIVGYDINERYWIVRNSWGTEWGDNGYFKISWDDKQSGVAKYNYSVSVEPVDGTMRLRNTDSVLTAPQKFTVETSYKHVFFTKIKFVSESGHEYLFRAHQEFKLSDLFKPNRKRIFSVDIDPKKLPDGVYKVSSEASVIRKWKKETLRSEPIRVTILNSTPQIDVAIEGLEQDDELVDLSSDITDRVFVRFAFDSNPVPINKLTFYAQHEDGTMFSVVNNQPKGKSYLSWRTYSIPNGNYTIWAKAEIGPFSQESETISVKVNNGDKTEELEALAVM